MVDWFKCARTIIAMHGCYSLYLYRKIVTLVILFQLAITTLVNMKEKLEFVYLD